MVCNIDLPGASTMMRAQEAFTYQQCAEYALNHNLTLQYSKLDVYKQRITRQNAAQRFLPRVIAGPSYGINNGKTLDATTNAYVGNNLFPNDWCLAGSMQFWSGAMLKGGQFDFPFFFNYYEEIDGKYDSNQTIRMAIEEYNGVYNKKN